MARHLIVDGNNLAYRVWMAYPELNTATGKSVGVIFGVIKLLKSMIQSHKATSVSVAWDGTPSVRKSIYAGYKDKRSKAKEEETPEQKEAYASYKQQMHELLFILPYFGIKQYKGDEVEADDVVAILARTSEHPALVVSEDKDFLQLVSENILVYRPIEGKLYTLDNFEEGVAKLHKQAQGLPTPAQYLQARVMIGDSSDDIPGVDGIGDKTGFDLIREHKSLAKILSNPDLNKGKRMAKLFDSQHILVRNLLLMDLKHSFKYVDVEMLAEIEVPALFNAKKVEQIMLKHEFFSFMKGIKEFLAPFSSLT